MFEKALRGFGPAILIAWLWPGGAPAATLNLTSDTVERQHQDPGTICVELVLRGGEQIAGTENLLIWNGECASILAETCEASPGHGKQLSGVVQRQRDFTYKGLILSLTDTDPIPPGELYCCDFLVHANPGSCCRVRIGSPGASDPDGNSMSLGAGAPGELCVADDGSSANDGISDDVFGGGGMIGGGGIGTDGVADGGSAGSPGGGSPSGGGSGGGGSASGAPAGAVVADLGADQPQQTSPSTVDDAPAPGRARPDQPAARQASERPSTAAAKPAQKDGRTAPQSAGKSESKPAVASTDIKKTKEAPVEQEKAGKTKAEGETAVADAKKSADSKQEAVEAETDDSAEEDESDAEPAGATAAVDTEKPSPRDVRRAQGAGQSGRERRMPLDDEGGWFGCQASPNDRSGAALALALPALLLLARSRRRI